MQIIQASIFQGNPIAIFHEKPALNFHFHFLNLGSHFFSQQRQETAEWFSCLYLSSTKFKYRGGINYRSWVVRYNTIQTPPPHCPVRITVDSSYPSLQHQSSHKAKQSPEKYHQRHQLLTLIINFSPAPCGAHFCRCHVVWWGTYFVGKLHHINVKLTFQLKKISRENSCT